MNFYDFNTAKEQDNFNVIPKGTIAKVNMRIKPGGYNDESQGWTNGYATKSSITEAVYLSCEFTILEGPYAKRKIWNLIGLYSEKNDNRWGAIGRNFICSILNSAKGFSNKDNSEAALAARKVSSFADLDGLEFVARIDTAEDQDGTTKNIIKTAIGPEHVEYDSIMGRASLPGWS